MDWIPTCIQFKLSAWWVDHKSSEECLEEPVLKQPLIYYSKQTFVFCLLLLSCFSFLLKSFFIVFCSFSLRLDDFDQLWVKTRCKLRIWCLWCSRLFLFPPSSLIHPSFHCKGLIFFSPPPSSLLFFSVAFFFISRCLKLSSHQKNEQRRSKVRRSWRRRSK